MSKNPRADIVFFTVNAHEQTQLHAAILNKTLRALKQVQGESTEIYYDAGEINGQRVYSAKSLIGSTGDGASFDTITNVIGDLNPRVIIAVGIAWGGREDSGQQIGDILLSTRVRDAQHHKVKPEKVILRGPVEASRGSLAKIFLAASEGASVRVHDGLLLSIETLFDDKQARDKFLASDDEQAIGGEMEGSGLLMALRRLQNRVDWLIVKGICDWGFKKNVDPAQKEKDQATAAMNAARFCVETVARFKLFKADSTVDSRRGALNLTAAQAISSKDDSPTRSIRDTVQAYVSKNSGLSIDVGYPIIHKDWPEKVIFELYQLSDELGGCKRFLYVHESANQSATLAHIHRYLSPAQPLFVLTEKLNRPGFRGGPNL
ncbi:5'-methylthioadenosine/S-adenosylhomocysteine nucleosidase family protein [Roseateles sp. P5_E1]